VKQRILLIILATLSVSACGRAGDLSPKTGQALPQAAYGQEERQKAPDLIRPSSQARPERSAELFSRSVRRETDPFDLPPGGDTRPVSDKPAKPAGPDDSQK